MPLLPGKGNVGRNISELHKGPQFQRTEANHGKATADKQAVAVAEHEAHKGGAGDPHSKAKAAIAKAHPVHLHRLMQDAHAGKFGSQAQQTAQQAMQGGGGDPMAQGDADGDNDSTAVPGPPQDFNSMFSSKGSQPPPPAGSGATEQPKDFNTMFGGR
jgi:hypothetical protein